MGTEGCQNPINEGPNSALEPSNQTEPKRPRQSPRSWGWGMGAAQQSELDHPQPWQPCSLKMPPPCEPRRRASRKRPQILGPRGYFPWGSVLPLQVGDLAPGCCHHTATLRVVPAPLQMSAPRGKGPCLIPQHWPCWASASVTYTAGNGGGICAGPGSTALGRPHPRPPSLHRAGRTARPWAVSAP